MTETTRLLLVLTGLIEEGRRDNTHGFIITLNALARKRYAGQGLTRKELRLLTREQILPKRRALLKSIRERRLVPGIALVTAVAAEPGFDIESADCCRKANPLESKKPGMHFYIPGRINGEGELLYRMLHAETRLHVGHKAALDIRLLDCVKAGQLEGVKEMGQLALAPLPPKPRLIQAPMPPTTEDRNDAAA